MDKNKASVSIEQCKRQSNIQQAVHKASPKILIASPSVVEQNKKQINLLREKYQLLLVGLVYAFQHPDSLTYFDALIYINDSADQIQSTINGLLKPSSTIDNATSNESLTKREKEILKLLVKGNTTKQIAKSLYISAHTVNAHRKNIMRKLDIKTISGLTIYAVLNNIISLKEA